MNSSYYFLVLCVLVLNGVDGIIIGRLINYFFNGFGRSQNNGNYVINKWHYLPPNNGIGGYQVNTEFSYTPSEIGKIVYKPLFCEKCVKCQCQCRRFIISDH